MCHRAAWHPVVQQPRSPHFEALSYCWGKDTTCEDIQVCPMSEHFGQAIELLAARKTLCEALRHLRMPNATRTLWIDAVCINQQAVDERNKQLPRMAFLYSHATKTIAWLGPASEDSAQAVRALHWISSSCMLS